MRAKVYISLEYTYFVIRNVTFKKKQFLFARELITLYGLFTKNYYICKVVNSPL